MTISYNKGFSIAAMFMAIAAFFGIGAHVTSNMQATTTDMTTNSSLQTYMNAQYGFSFQYPSGFTAEINDGDGSMPKNMIWVRIYCQNVNSSCGRKEFALYVESTSTGLTNYIAAGDSVSAVAYEGQPSVTIKSQHALTVDGVSGVQRDQFANAAGFETLSTYFKSGNNVYNLRIDPDDKGQTMTSENIAIYNNILSSFKFTPATQSASYNSTNPNMSGGLNADVKMYSNSENNFSVNYPSSWKVQEYRNEKTNKLNSIGFNNGSSSQDTWSISFRYQPDSSAVKLIAQMNTIFGSNIQGKEQISISGVSATKITISQTGSNGKVYHVIFDKSGITYDISGTDSSQFTSFISSFKFTNN